MSLVPVVLGFLIMMAMTGKQMQEKMKEYQNALDDMSNEAVEVCPWDSGGKNLWPDDLFL